MRRHETGFARHLLDRQLAPLRQLALEPPPNGWIRAIRESLGMTTRQLAARLGVAPSRIGRIQHDEVTGATTLKTLRQTAGAMDCRVVYALLPAISLGDTVHERAKQKAREASDIDEERHCIVSEFVFGISGGLWDD